MVVRSGRERERGRMNDDLVLSNASNLASYAYGETHVLLLLLLRMRADARSS